MSDICQWCSNTSSAIDSLNDQVEHVTKERDELQARCDRLAAENHHIIKNANALYALEFAPATSEHIKEIATKFYYWWHNTSGTNTQQGFDSWWELYLQGKG